MLDKNKTVLTSIITATCAKFLADRGFDIIESEVGYAGKYLGDVVGFGFPSLSLIEKLGIVFPRNNRWIKDYSSIDGLHRPLCALIEVKQSMADFVKDRNTKFVQRYCHLNYVAYPLGLIKVDEIPVGWIGLETTRDGKRVWRIHGSIDCVYRMSVEELLEVVSNVAVRYKNHNQYKWYNDMLDYVYGKEPSHSSAGRIVLLLQWLEHRLNGLFPQRHCVDVVERILPNIHLHPEVRRLAQQIDKQLEKC
jgi:hypothetical protein